MVGKKFFEKLPELREHLVELEEPVLASAINGTCVIHKYYIDFNIKINGTTYDLRALYSPRIRYTVVLGLDFLRRHEIEFDFKRDTINSSRASRVKTGEDITLPPLSESIIWATTKSIGQGDALVTGSDIMPQLNVLVAGTIVRANENNQVPVRVLNLNTTQKVIRKNTHVAQLRLLGKNDKVVACAAGTTQPAPRATVPTDFQDQFDLSKSVLDPEQTQELMQLLWEYKDIFSKKESKLGCTNVMQFEIELKDDAAPFKARPYRSNPHVRQEIRRQVQDMLDKDIIEPSTSNFGSPVLLVPKPDGSYRFCIDYRKLNSMTKTDCHPIARADDCLESLGASGAKFFSSLDLESGYWQVPVHPNSRPYTAFVTHDGLYQCKRMSFGLVNAPSVFSRLMTRVLQDLN
jgi:hypothetical protein